MQTLITNNINFFICQLNRKLIFWLIYFLLYMVNHLFCHFHISHSTWWTVYVFKKIAALNVN